MMKFEAQKIANDEDEAMVVHEEVEMKMVNFDFEKDHMKVEVEHIEICQVGTAEETVVGMTFQATDVKKALAAVWRVCEKGNVIQFGDEPEDCFIKNKKTNRKIFMRKKKGSYVLDVEFVMNGE